MSASYTKALFDVRPDEKNSVMQLWKETIFQGIQINFYSSIICTGISILNTMASAGALCDVPLTSWNMTATVILAANAIAFGCALYSNPEVIDIAAQKLTFGYVSMNIKGDMMHQIIYISSATLPILQLLWAGQGFSYIAQATSCKETAALMFGGSIILQTAVAMGSILAFSPVAPTLIALEKLAGFANILCGFDPVTSVVEPISNVIGDDGKIFFSR